MSRSMQATLKAAVAALALAGAASVSATTLFTPLNGTLIETTITNDSGKMLAIEFDLSDTHTSDGSTAVFDKLYGVREFTPASTSQSFLFGVSGGSTFGFYFNDFESGQSFKFGWDPDSAINPLFGALPSDLAGTKVRAVIEGVSKPSFLYGVMTLDSAGNLGTTLAPVPEPGTYALMLAGLALVGAVARRQRAG